MTEPLVSVQLVVKDGQRYLRACLDAVRAQTYRNLEVVILDNASTDATPTIIAAEYSEFRLIRGDRNLGMWPGQELLLAQTQGEYVQVLSVDVVIAPDFIAQAVVACQEDPSIAAVQAKVYQAGNPDKLLDTCGFALTRGRKVVNLGHGQLDGAAFQLAHQIFGVEGAVPFFRRRALENCRIQGHVVDPDYFWYGDDLDLAWRMTLLGHKQVFLPKVIAWHDRSTTKSAATKPILGQLQRLHMRRAIPLQKRRWDWSNVRFTILKNDYIINILRDLPWILWRELMVFGYTLLFEPAVFLEAGRFLRLLPRMWHQRRLVMHKARLSPQAMRQFFQ